MAYTKTQYVDGVTPLNAKNFNKNEGALEQVSKDIDVLSSAITQVDSKVDGKANSNHTHSEYATTSALNNKVDKVSGKGLSTNDFTTVEKNKLASLQNSDVTKAYVDTELDKKSDKTNTYTKSEVDNKIAEAQLGGDGGNIDLSGYATKDDLLTKAEKVHAHTEYASKSSEHTHDNKTALDKVTDAKMNSWDSKATGNHNHNSSYSPLGHRHDASEIDNLPSSGGSSTPVIDNLTSTSTTSALSANQGKVLDNKITVLNDKVGDLSKLNTTNKNNLVDVINELLALISDNPQVPSVNVESVSLDKTSLSITVGDVAMLVHTIKPEHATNKNVTWTSSDNKIITIENGLVTAISNGNATITVTTEDGNKTASCEVLVESVVEGFDIRYLIPTVSENPLTFPNELHPNPNEPDLVHPSVLYFKNSWNGYKYWMAINPYTDTQSRNENPCMIVSNDGENWEIPNGINTPIFGAPPTGHNSDCHIFMDKDGVTMHYINRWADGTSTIELMSSTDGVTWTEKKTIIPKSSEYDHLSPSVCIYNNEYYMFTIDNILWGSGIKNKITVLKCATVDGNWTKVNDIVVEHFPSIWHLEVQYIDNEFIGLIMTEQAQGGNLAIFKFNTPMDEKVISSVGALCIGVGGSQELWNTLYYKSSFVKTSNGIKIFANGKSRATLDAFCKWRVGVIDCEFNNNIKDFSEYKLVKEYPFSEFIKDLKPPFGYFNEANSIHTPITNGVIEFSIDVSKEIHVAFKVKDTTDFWEIKKDGGSLSLRRQNGGNIQNKNNISAHVTNDSTLKLEFIDNTYNLYVDDRLFISNTEVEYKDKEHYIKKMFSYMRDCSPVGNIKIYAKDNIYSLNDANKNIAEVKNQFSQDSSKFATFNDFESKPNGTISVDDVGNNYITEGALPSVTSGKLVCNANQNAFIDISNCSKYEFIAKLSPLYNKHNLYLYYADGVNLSFGLKGQFYGYGFEKKINDAISKKLYNISPDVFNGEEDKIVKCIVDFNLNEAVLYINNQFVSKMDISDIVKSDTFKVGMGADMANCGFKFISVRKLD
ncbi:MAG: Ig-like domain-containing protein [Paraclostridium sp.]